MAYCTVANLKTYLGIPSGTTTDDALLTDLVASAQAMIDAATGRTFEASQDSTRYLDAVRDVDGRELIFDADICSITSVTNGDSVVVATNEYATMPRNETPYYGIRLLSSSGKAWTYTDDAEGAIAVVGKWAYSETAPADIEHACKRLAAYMYRQKDNAQDLDRAVVVGNATLLPSQLPGDVMNAIRHYVPHVGR